MLDCVADWIFGGALIPTRFVRFGLLLRTGDRVAVFEVIVLSENLEE